MLDKALWKNSEIALMEIFREISSLVTSLVKTMLTRNVCQKCVRVNLRKFYSVEKREILCHADHYQRFHVKFSITNVIE